MAEKRTQKPRTQTAKTLTVGDEIEVPEGETYMVLPDGSVTTVRKTYVANAPGTYVCGSLRVEVKAKAPKSAK